MDVSRASGLLKGRNLWLWIVILALLGAGAMVMRSLLFAPAATQTQEAAPLPEQVAVAALGRLEPETEVIQVGGPVGDRIVRLEVNEGDYVTKGVVLAYLESYEERLAERDYAASQLDEAQKRMQAETQFGQAQIQEAQTRLQQVDQPQELEVQAQQATIRQLEAELSLAQIDLARFETLQRDGAISQQDLDQQRSQTRQIEEKLNNARVTLARLETARSTDMNNAEAQVQSQRASLERSQAQIEVESAARNLQLAEARLDRTLIRAPSDGEILRIIAQQGEAITEQGILEMGDTQQMYVVAEVYETDVSKVKIGQTATITSRNGAFDQTLTGKVARIGSQIFKNNVLDDDPAANADARIVEVRIRLDQSEAVAKLTNLQVDVKIDVEE
jgi:HlyD family secretion protein